MRIVLCFCFVAPLFIGGVAIASPYLAQPLPWSHENFLPGMLFGLFAIAGTRFLILPWIRIPHLASHILGLVTRALSGDWNRLYSHPVYFAETFIDPGRFRGTCYRAANWVLMGQTTGRGKASNSHHPNRSIKEILGLPLTPHFRELLSEEEE